MQPGEKFSTLKTRRILHKELDEHAGQGGEMREQFAAYRRLRTQHQKQLKQVDYSLLPHFPIWCGFSYDVRCFIIAGFRFF